MNRSSILLLGLLASACSKKADQPGGPQTKSAEPAAAGDISAAAIPAKLPPAFAAWDLAARAKAWQGAWLTEASLGFPIALDVKGATATTWDGTAEKHLGFALESPCSAQLIEHGADGSTSSTITHFTLRQGKLVAGLGDAGSRNGKAAVACVSNRVMTLDDSGICSSWSSMFDDWKSSPGICSLGQKDGKEVFTATIDGHDYTLAVDGDALLSEQLAGHSSAPFPDFAAAKRARH